MLVQTRLLTIELWCVYIAVAEVNVAPETTRRDHSIGVCTMRLIVRRAACIPMVLVVVFCCGTTLFAETHGRGELPEEPSPAGSTAVPRKSESPWVLEARIRKYVNSHTSYEFGNPFPPHQVPLSRLEFPLDSIWGGLEVRRSFNRFSAGVEFLTSFRDQETGRFKDSDWDDDAEPALLTIYGETNCRLEPSYQVRADLDMQVADLLGLSGRFDLRPVIGLRRQRFSLVAHDGAQVDVYGPGVLLLPGDSIAFEQKWSQYFVGLKFGYDFGPKFGLHRLKLGTQLDWGEVDGENEDRHLLRVGNRVTTENTDGHAWHGMLGIVAGLTKIIDLGLEVDYLRIKSTGTHRLQNDLFDLDFSFSNGVTVWSEQTSIIVKLAYRF